MCLTLDERTRQLVEGFGDEGWRLAQAIDGRLRSGLPSQLQLQSIMLSGRSGIGKSLLLSTLSPHYGSLIRIHPARVVASGSQHHGLKQQLGRISADVPTVVWLVDVELFRGLYGAVVAEFLRGMERMPRCVVVMTTRNPERVATQVRQLCDDHIRLLPPDNSERLQLARWFARNSLPQDSVESIASEARGKIAAELFAAVSTHICANATDSVHIAAAQPASSVCWSDIGGLDGVIAELEEALVWPLRLRDQFVRLGIRPTRGILLHGPPGTGKTMLAKAAAHHVSANFIAVAIPDLIKGEIGESEKALARVFETARRGPSIVFLDEVEAIFGSRESSGEVGKKLVTQLFLELDGIPDDANVVVLAATNERRLIDDAILRAGRLDRQIHIPMPDARQRLDILHKATRHLQIEDTSVFAGLAESEMTGAEISSLVRYACYSAIQRGTKTLNRQDFEAALQSVQTTADHFFP
ncbi:hypothetical protein GGF43_002625 [Coemansia sp. RSA 2618]|nr:hypothetical protein GGF43_002625 [Coemansia sp. RSA 2618]